MALSSVVTPEMTNMRRKVMMISITKDCQFDPTGTVPKYAAVVTSSIKANVPLARVDPIN